MIFKPKRLGMQSLPDYNLENDKKNCRKFGPCGVGEKAVYLGSFYLDRVYYIPFCSISRMFKRVAMSKDGFTGKGAFGTLSYPVVVYDNGSEKQCNFRHEEDVDRLLAFVREQHPDMPVHSVKAERELKQREQWLLDRKKSGNMSPKIRETVDELERAKQYLDRRPQLYTNLSAAARKKRTYDRTNPAYKWAALAITLFGIGALAYGIYAVITRSGTGMYFLLFGMAAVFFFSGANVLPTAKNNRRYIENYLKSSVEAMGCYLKEYPDFPLPAYYAHPVVLERMQEILKNGRANGIPEALEILKKDLKALNSGVYVEKEEYDEVMAIKPMFLVMDYK